eukprot:EG_transcript_42086
MHIFLVPGCEGRFYRYFRVVLDPRGNDEGTSALVLNCFELYGYTQSLAAVATTRAGVGRQPAGRHLMAVDVWAFAGGSQLLRKALARFNPTQCQIVRSGDRSHMGFGA